LVLPPFGDPNAAIHMHVAPYYLENAIVETHVPNIVTAVLADYRGFDTLGETIVVFTAGIGVLLLLTGLRRRGAGVNEGSPKEKENSN
jgi:multicomponent Na+:H+ antiporter subunit B